MHSRSTLPRTRESLFILLQHNLVTFAENQEGDRLVVYYTAEIRNALLLNRYPIMMAQAEKQFGEAVTKAKIIYLV
jgi:DNA-directed RNA polymerase III subunit RPC3